MRNTFILLAGLFVLSACKTTEEKQQIHPVSLSSQELKARVEFKGGKEVLITNRLDNIRIADIEKITVLDDEATWEFFYRDKERQIGGIKLKKKSETAIDRDKILIVIDGVETPKDFDLNSLKTDRIKSINVYKGAKMTEKFNTKEFESVIEIFTK